MVVVTFRNRFNPGIDEEEYGQRVGKLFEIVSAMPGFRGIRSYAAEDGEQLSLIELDSRESLAAWRDHAEHRDRAGARQAGVLLRVPPPDLRARPRVAQGGGRVTAATLRREPREARLHREIVALLDLLVLLPEVGVDAVADLSLRKLRR